MRWKGRLLSTCDQVLLDAGEGWERELKNDHNTGKGANATLLVHTRPLIFHPRQPVCHDAKFIESACQYEVGWGQTESHALFFGVARVS